MSMLPSATDILVMKSSMDYLNGLTVLPVQAKCQWVSKTVATNPPQYIPHTEYAFYCELTAAVPVLATLILSDGRALIYQKFWRSAAYPQLALNLSFFPYDWHYSDEVQISLYQKVPSQGGGIWLSVCSESLKRDPRQAVVAHLAEAASIYTGTVIDLAGMNLSPPVQAQVIVLVKDDTESSHGRWRLRSSLSIDLPPYLSFLRQGRCSGRVLL